jgi:hypothetical protein
VSNLNPDGTDVALPGIRLRKNGVAVDAVNEHGFRSGHRSQVNLQDGTGIALTVTDEHISGPEREWKVKVENTGAAAVHGVTHADGGTDEITTALDPRAYPLLSDVIANRPAFGVLNRFFWATDERILYRDSGSAWEKAAVADYPDLNSIPSSFTPASHVLATNTGLGAEHTISGAAAGQVLRASSATAANFGAIVDTDLPAHKTRHETGGADALTGNLNANARVTARLNNVDVVARRKIDFLDGGTIAFSVVDGGALAEDIDISAEVTAHVRKLVTLDADVASTASTSYQNITGLSFSMTSGVNYRVYAMILYTTSANTIGIRVSWSGPTMTHSAYFTRTAPGTATGGPPTGTTDVFWENAQNAADLGTTSQASLSTTAGNLLIFEGVFRPSSTATFQMRFAPETATASGVVIEAGSMLEWW